MRTHIQSTIRKIRTSTNDKIKNPADINASKLLAHATNMEWNAHLYSTVQYRAEQSSAPPLYPYHTIPQAKQTDRQI